MFLSKIWFFLIALVAAVGLAVALVMPRPAQRELENEEHNRLAIACNVVDILLADDARNRVELASSFARAPEIVTALDAASNADKLDIARMKQVREHGETLMQGIQGHKPSFAMLIDRRGRVVARITLDSEDFGDVVAGRPLIDDALAGYSRDDLWAQNGTMYFVSAAPVIKRDPPVAYVGAIVLGHKVTNDLAAKLVASLSVDVGFSLGASDVAGSKSITIDHAPLQEALKALAGNDVTHDCQDSHPLDIHAGNDSYTAVVARLPGEAMAKQAYFTVLVKKPEARGFWGSLTTARKSDLSFANFPWILVGGGFVVVLALGIGFMWIESDRPLRRLAADAVRLAKNETERLGEDTHGGKFGSIARSVNIHIDKLGRDAKSARTNLDQLLGPAPEGSLGTIDLLAGALPAARPGGAAPAAAPGPSEFKFHDPAPAAPAAATAMTRPTPPAAAPRPPTPRPIAPPPPAPPAPLATPPRGIPAPAAIPHGTTQPLSLEDDILGSSTPPPPPALDTPPPVDPYFKQVYDQFLSVKKSCGEPTGGLTYHKFAEKLVKNRDELIAKTSCREVRFTVYVKDGKAALKATPVKEE